jgi:transcriptional regulator with XRE-family HTH domain
VEREARFRDIADFLSRCRKRTTPGQVGLTAGLRQRLRGLRREQVAQLAGISETWYSRLEQGRQRGVSHQVLNSIATALQLDPVEREYLLLLASEPRPVRQPTADVLHSLQQFVESQELVPAFVLGPRWDILVWNQAASSLFGDLGRLPAGRRNVLWLVFGTPVVAQMVGDWEPQARATLAQFRLSWARHRDQREFSELVQALSAASPEFRRWWVDHDVRPRPARRRAYEHPVAGRLEVEMQLFRVHDEAELWYVVFAPVAGSGTQARLRELIRARPVCTEHQREPGAGDRGSGGHPP